MGIKSREKVTCFIFGFVISWIYQTFASVIKKQNISFATSGHDLLVIGGHYFSGMQNTAIFVVCTNILVADNN